MNDTQKILAQFNSKTLDEISAVSLMNRMDEKYIFNQKQLNDILIRLNDYYAIFEHNGQRIFTYESLYFDTKKYDLFQFHQRKKLNRYKFRIRKYVESDLQFFEIKFKNNKGKTHKMRIPHKEINLNTKDFIQQNSPFQLSELEQKIWVNYKRITLVNIETKERITFDTEIHFIDNHEDIMLDNLVIAELKQDKTHTSFFRNLMHELHIRQGGISKYCLGLCNLNSNLKQNNFKPYLHHISKILTH